MYPTQRVGLGQLECRLGGWRCGVRPLEFFVQRISMAGIGRESATQSDVVRLEPPTCRVQGALNAVSERVQLQDAVAKARDD